jgi:SagB-type dehydrogenase family enzyme
VRTWREYHERTKHSAEALRRAPHFLDWANMPDPFRHYEGVPVLDLPPPGTVPVGDGSEFLSQLLFHSAAISATKLVPSTGSRYALRVNPSSGNLHPTEFHFATRGLKQWPDGLYHYRPSSHMAEQRATGDFVTPLGAGSAPIVFVLTSIAWREAWKYRNRAYRYCLHDMGHAWQALALAAQAMQCDSYAVGQFPDDEVARLCRLNADEWPMLLMKLTGAAIPGRSPDSGQTVWFNGSANQLSSEQIPYPLIDEMHAATKAGGNICAAAPAGKGSWPASWTRSFQEVVRARRSALDFRGGSASMSFAQLAAILDYAVQPLFADFAASRFIDLYLYAHRVEGLPPGVYRYRPARGELEPVRAGDQRVAAAGLSLGQDLAGNACVAFTMLADLDRAAALHGDRGYRYVYFEAGAIGQRLYLGAEALGLRATGIGAFFDDEVHRYLNVTPEQGQVVYHFAIGYPVFDSRLEA